jgi:hypothetical protein
MEVSKFDCEINAPVRKLYNGSECAKIFPTGIIDFKIELEVSTGRSDKKIKALLFKLIEMLRKEKINGTFIGVCHE